MINLVDLIRSYRKFSKTKNKKPVVAKFILNSESELWLLYQDIISGQYKHGGYRHFKIIDSKLREVDEAVVRDRVVHQLVYDYLVAVYDRFFYYHSYAARKGKGLHSALIAFKKMSLAASKGFKQPVYVLKLDIKKFFANVNKTILLDILVVKNLSLDYHGLISEVINSFKQDDPKGIPLGNLTSQILANIYLDSLDNFIKHQLKVRYYLRYMDDFIILSSDKMYLINLLPLISSWLKINLDLELNKKITIDKLDKGIDLLGYKIFPHYNLVSHKTAKKIERKMKIQFNKYQLGLINEKSFYQSRQSYLGILKYAKAENIKRKLVKITANTNT